MRPASAVQAVDCGALKHIEVKRRTKVMATGSPAAAAFRPGIAYALLSKRY